MSQQPILGNVYVLACQEISMTQVGAVLLVQLFCHLLGSNVTDIIESKYKMTRKSTCGLG